MDLNARRRRVHVKIEDSNATLYNHDLSLYHDYPKVQIKLTEFEELALERLQLLRIIEQASLKGHKMFTDNWRQCIKEDLIKNNLKKFVRLMSGLCGQTELDIQARKADHISHYILRLAYCRSEDLRRWFLSRELEWFKIRFMVQSPAAILNFLQLNNLKYMPISNEEKDELKSDLIASTPGMSDVLVSTTDFYKVPFVDVLPLVKNRRVFLKLGYAYIPMTDLVVCIQSKYRAALSESLNLISHRLPNVDDERITDLLCNLHLTYTGKEYVAGENKDAINPADLDEFSKKHYPLCMRHLHEGLKANHHLKHGGRLMYGLFVKAIGVLYEHFIDFWRQEFTQIIDHDKFDKQYLYGFNHMYGKVGRMVDYSPYSCIKIIMGNVGPGESHGCPFKHWDSGILKSKMNEHGVSQEGVQEISTLVTNGHFQIACTKYFEHTHGKMPVNTINHPNQYFEESVNLDKEKSGRKTK